MPLKLFVVGENSADPETWDDDYSLVLAADAEQARKMADQYGQHVYQNSPVTEVSTEIPCVLVHVPTVDYPSSW